MIKTVNARVVILNNNQPVFFFSKTDHQYELPMMSLNRAFQSLKEFVFQDDKPFERKISEVCNCSG